jgi:hypothetical protein
LDTQALETSPLREDYLTITLLSGGLAEILRRRARARSGEANTDGVLPAAWRIGFARLWLRHAESGELPGWSDLDLMALCGRPMTTWPVALDLSEADLKRQLLDGGRLSDFAEQGARFAGPDIEANWTEHHIYENLVQAASANGRTSIETYEAYACLRRFLIDHAVLDDIRVSALGRRFGARDNSGQTYVLKLIQAAYDERPTTSSQRFQLCSRCVDLAPLAVIYEQNRATRRYIHDPGLVEARILDTLSESKLSGKIRVTPYPALDQLDVLIEFLDRGSLEPRVVETWGVDAKDQVSAHLLGQTFAWTTDIECDRRILALPMHRSRQPGYVADLSTTLEGRVRGVDVIDEDRLVREVSERVSELANQSARFRPCYQGTSASETIRRRSSAMCATGWATWVGAATGGPC